MLNIISQLFILTIFGKYAVFQKRVTAFSKLSGTFGTKFRVNRDLYDREITEQLVNTIIVVVARNIACGSTGRVNKKAARKQHHGYGSWYLLLVPDGFSRIICTALF